MARFHTPAHILEVLQEFGCTDVYQVGHVGDNAHPTIQFRMPDGSVRRWTWPLERRAGLRAMKNNRAQLRKKLMGIINESHSIPRAGQEHSGAASR
jgi:hypothetical protein